MASLNYLTVQDILWINLQVTKKVQHFNYARLEEATYYEYAYGESNTLLPQAARFLSGFLKMHPFEAGNEATAFAAFVTLLRINNHDVCLTDDQARSWFDGVLHRRSKSSDAVTSVAIEAEGHHEGKPDIRAAIRSVLEDFPCTILNLA